MTISAERREELLDEMYEMGDSRQVTDDPQRLESFPNPLTYGELRTLLHDSARLERIERQVRELVDEWECEADDPSTTIVGDPDDIYRNLAAALRAIVDTGRGDCD